VVKLAWQGDADLDLQVKGPAGSVCSPLNRRTVGGGVLIGDSLADMTSETYLAAQAFPGQYQVHVERVWGHPLGNKAQLKVIRHQGTPGEIEEVKTIDLSANQPITVTLKVGHRTETAYVPPPTEARALDGPTAAPTEEPDHILHQLAVLADPEVTAFERGFSGGMSSAGIPAPASRPLTLPERSPEDRTLMRTRVASFVRNSLEVTAQAELSADRRAVRISLSPVYSPAAALGPPVIDNPLIPGGR
jgi:hypothetical protein